MSDKSTPRVEGFRERQAKLDRRKREYYLTDSEHEVIKKEVKSIREKSNG